MYQFGLFGGQAPTSYYLKIGHSGLTFVTSMLHVLIIRFLTLLARYLDSNKLSDKNASANKSNFLIWFGVSSYFRKSICFFSRSSATFFQSR